MYYLSNRQDNFKNNHTRGGNIMTTLIQSDGKELEIARGSYVYMKNEAGVDVYREWKDLSAVEKEKFIKTLDDLDKLI